VQLIDRFEMPEVHDGGTDTLKNWIENVSFSMVSFAPGTSSILAADAVKAILWLLFRHGTDSVSRSIDIYRPVA
jgi:hypothetical protein